MEIIIRGDKITVTDAIREYVTSKFEKLDKYFENPEEIKAYVNVKVNNLSQIIEVTIPTTKFTLRAEERHQDLYAATDLMIDKLERQIRKNKTRLKNKFKTNDLMELNLNFEVTPEEVNENKIVKRKNIEMKPMDEEEAILQAELLDHDFFVFKNIDEECISVLYKRKDGRYGIINVR